MALKMYDLCGKDKSRRFSPFCWRIKMALAHKGLETEFIPWRFTEKETISQTNQGLVPVLVDGDRWLHDSWNIALYLDQQYPQKPLMGGEQAKALTQFARYWVDSQLSGIILKLVVNDIPGKLDAEDAEYFITSREQRLGQSLEAFAGDSEKNLKQLHATLLPARLTLKKQLFLCGDHPAYADYTLFSVFQWARSVSTTPLLDDPQDSLYLWRERMLDLYDGLARRAPAA